MAYLTVNDSRGNYYSKVPCKTCEETGRIKGQRNTNLLVSHDHRRRKTCPDCNGDGYTLVRHKR